jgi:hypothetical protein
MSLPQPEYDPGIPSVRKQSAADIKALTNFEMVEEFPRWETDDESWEEFRREVGRMSLLVGTYNIRSYVYTDDKIKKLGIFIHHAALPSGGAVGLF